MILDLERAARAQESTRILDSGFWIQQDSGFWIQQDSGFSGIQNSGGFRDAGVLEGFCRIQNSAMSATGPA